MRHPLAASPRHWPLAARERFEEKAALFEYGDGLPRGEAERRAEALVRAQWNPTEVRAA